MKIIYKTGDVTDADEKAILHGCNAQGVMGSGVALAIRKKFPKAYSDYVFEHRTDGLKMGAVYHTLTQGVFIFNAITQCRYGVERRHVDYEALYTALEYTNGLAYALTLKAVAMPRIGAGLGGGNWAIISTMIEETSSNYQPIVYDLQ